MENDSKKELARLKRELAAMNRENTTISADIPLDVVETVPMEPEIPTVPEENTDSEILYSRSQTNKLLRRENRWLVGLMITASLLCAGIIAILIYWLEVWLK